MNQSELPDASGSDCPPSKTSPFWIIIGLLALVAVFVAVEYMLYQDLVRLESGRVESIRVNSIVKSAYEWFGFYGALAAMPALGAIAIALNVYRAWKLHGSPARTETIERVEWNVQLIVVTIICFLFGLPFILAGMALVIMPLLEGNPGGQKGSILPAIAGGLGVGWIGFVFWFIAWRNRPWGPNRRRRRNRTTNAVERSESLANDKYNLCSTDSRDSKVIPIGSNACVPPEAN